MTWVSALVLIVSGTCFADFGHHVTCIPCKVVLAQEGSLMEGAASIASAVRLWIASF
jgi:hypothetical protein